MPVSLWAVTYAGLQTDLQCDAPPTYSYEYKSAATGTLLPYEPANPPGSALIATTTTENGQVVPFIVRTEPATVESTAAGVPDGRV